MTTIVCANCKKKSEKPTKEITRQRKQGRLKFYCSLSCSSSNTQITTHKIISKCLWCKNDFYTTTHKNHRKCCSKLCAYKYSRSFVNPQKISTSLKEYNKLHPRHKIYPIEKTFICTICKLSFIKTIRSQFETYKTCGDTCYRKLVSQWTRNNPNCGGKLGYRRFLYKGYKMDSRWEVELAKWMDNRKIKWNRNKKRYMFWWIDENGNRRKYFPDFYLPDYKVYLDPKNAYYLKRDLPKLQYVINTYNIILFYGNVEDIKNSIDKLWKNVIIKDVN